MLCYAITAVCFSLHLLAPAKSRDNYKCQADLQKKWEEMTRIWRARVVVENVVGEMALDKKRGGNNAYLTGARHLKITRGLLWKMLARSSKCSSSNLILISRHFFYFCQALFITQFRLEWCIRGTFLCKIIPFAQIIMIIILTSAENGEILSIWVKCASSPLFPGNYKCASFPTKKCFCKSARHLQITCV